MRVKAYKTSNFSSTEKTEGFNPKNILLSGIVDDFDAVSTALKTFPYKSLVSLIGVTFLVFVTFKVGTKFGMIESRFKRKGI